MSASGVSAFLKALDMATKLFLETLGLRAPAGGHSVSMWLCPHRHRVVHVEKRLCKSYLMCFVVLLTCREFIVGTR